MRGLSIVFGIISLMLALLITNELGIIPIQQHPQTNMSLYDDISLNSTMLDYGMGNIPAQTTDSFYLFQGSGLLSGFKALYDFFFDIGLGFGGWMKGNLFPAVAMTLVTAISVYIFLQLTLLAISFFRGWYPR